MICVVVTAPGRPLTGNLGQRLKGHQACFVDDAALDGQVANYWRALRVARDLCERYRLEQILVLEDDVELCTGALEYIEAFPVPPDLAFLEWFDGAHPAAVPFTAVFTGLPPWGLVPGLLVKLQAVTWPLRTIRALFEAWPLPPAWWTPKHGGDDLLTCIAGDLGWDWRVHLPNLVQHVGAVSLVDAKRTLTGKRISKNYPGADFDARTLWAGKAVGHGGG